MIYGTIKNCLKFSLEFHLFLILIFLKLIMLPILWNKYRAETLKVTLERFRSKYPKYLNSKITYAGRLDPMAEGLILLLADDDVIQKESFLAFDKSYELSFIFGVSTDTYDILGYINKYNNTHNIDKNQLKEKITRLCDLNHQKYPPYSSRTVSGKPLWQWARLGMMDYIETPSRQIQIYNTHYLGSQKISCNDIRTYIIDSIRKVKGDFRQGKIISLWEEYFLRERDTTLYTIRVSASSGTYMRSLVHILGMELGCFATTVSIKRTQIGDYLLSDV